MRTQKLTRGTLNVHQLSPWMRHGDGDVSLQEGGGEWFTLDRSRLNLTDRLR